jgi:hypothetical protein
VREALICYFHLSLIQKLKIKNRNTKFDEWKVTTTTRIRKDKNNSFATFPFIPRLIRLRLGWTLDLSLMGQNMGLTQLVIIAIEDPIKIRKENNLKCLILI